MGDGFGRERKNSSHSRLEELVKGFSTKSEEETCLFESKKNIYARALDRAIAALDPDKKDKEIAATLENAGILMPDLPQDYIPFLEQTYEIQAAALDDFQNSKTNTRRNDSARLLKDIITTAKPHLEKAEQDLNLRKEEYLKILEHTENEHPGPLAQRDRKRLLNTAITQVEEIRSHVRTRLETEKHIDDLLAYPYGILPIPQQEEAPAAKVEASPQDTSTTIIEQINVVDEKKPSTMLLETAFKPRWIYSDAYYQIIQITRATNVGPSLIQDEIEKKRTELEISGSLRRLPDNLCSLYDKTVIQGGALKEILPDYAQPRLEKLLGDSKPGCRVKTVIKTSAEELPQQLYADTYYRLDQLQDVLGRSTKNLRTRYSQIKAKLSKHPGSVAKIPQRMISPAATTLIRGDFTYMFAKQEDMGEVIKNVFGMQGSIDDTVEAQGAKERTWEERTQEELKQETAGPDKPKRIYIHNTYQFKEMYAGAHYTIDQIAHTFNLLPSDIQLRIANKQEELDKDPASVVDLPHNLSIGEDRVIRGDHIKHAVPKQKLDQLGDLLKDHLPGKENREVLQISVENSPREFYADTHYKISQLTELIGRSAYSLGSAITKNKAYLMKEGAIEMSCKHLFSNKPFRLIRGSHIHEGAKQADKERIKNAVIPVQGYEAKDTSQYVETVAQPETAPQPAFVEKPETIEDKVEETAGRAPTTQTLELPKTIQIYNSFELDSIYSGVHYTIEQIANTFDLDFQVMQELRDKTKEDLDKDAASILEVPYRFSRGKEHMIKGDHVMYLLPEEKLDDLDKMLKDGTPDKEDRNTFHISMEESPEQISPDVHYNPRQLEQIIKRKGGGMSSTIAQHRVFLHKMGALVKLEKGLFKGMPATLVKGSGIPEIAKAKDKDRIMRMLYTGEEVAEQVEYEGPSEEQIDDSLKDPLKDDEPVKIDVQELLAQDAYAEKTPGEVLVDVINNTLGESIGKPEENIEEMHQEIPEVIAEYSGEAIPETTSCESAYDTPIGPVEAKPPEPVAATIEDTVEEYERETGQPIKIDSAQAEPAEPSLAAKESSLEKEIAQDEERLAKQEKAENLRALYIGEAYPDAVVPGISYTGYWIMKALGLGSTALRKLTANMEKTECPPGLKHPELDFIVTGGQLLKKIKSSGMAFRERKAINVDMRDRPSDIEPSAFYTSTQASRYHTTTLHQLLSYVNDHDAELQEEGKLIRTEKHVAGHERVMVRGDFVLEYNPRKKAPKKAKVKSINSPAKKPENEELPDLSKAMDEHPQYAHAYNTRTRPANVVPPTCEQTGQKYQGPKRPQWYSSMQAVREIVTQTGAESDIVVKTLVEYSGREGFLDKTRNNQITGKMQYSNVLVDEVTKLLKAR